MLWLRYVMVSTMKAVFTTAAGTLPGKRDLPPWDKHKWRDALMRQTLGMLSVVICLSMTTNSIALAADAGAEDCERGESLIEQRE